MRMTTSYMPNVDRPRPVPQTRVTRAMLEGVERDLMLAYRIGGMHTALGVLNARTRFRVTALCPLQPRSLACVSYDRENLHGLFDASLGEVCSSAQAIADDFGVARAGSDTSSGSRGAPSPIAFASRTGALVLAASGAAWGVLFHYDLRLRVATLKERQILEHFGRRFPVLFPQEIGALA